MKLGSFDGGFGRVESDVVVPMGPDLAAYLAGAAVVEGEPIPLASVRPIAPVPRPGKVIGVGLNYRDHAGESGQPIPEEPILFPKFANSVIGPGAPIVIPSATKEPDYEAELGVVIGRTASNVSEAKALSHVGGYTCVNDVSARDLQFRSSQWMLGKAIDTFLPCGPWVVTPEEIPDPQALAIRSDRRRDPPRLDDRADGLQRGGADRLHHPDYDPRARRPHRDRHAVRCRLRPDTAALAA